MAKVLSEMYAFMGPPYSFNRDSVCGRAEWISSIGTVIRTGRGSRTENVIDFRSLSESGGARDSVSGYHYS